ncbi:MAG: C4-type zinc ribbon domain-containing protein [Anaerolineae bacterium]|jgi:predicted  nucleic acid-binding Zn-ribbon protein
MDRALRLYRLQRLDSEEEQAQDRLAQIEVVLGDDSALRQARQQVQDTKDEVRRLTTRQQDLELQASGLRRKIEDSEKRLYSGNIRNPKELSDLQAEGASLKQRLERVEGKLLRAMISREEAETEAEQAREQLAAINREWTAKQHELLNEGAELEARLKDITDARARLLSSIPEDDLDAYRALRRTKKGLAVAPMRAGACTGCGMEVPSGQLQQGRQRGLLYCDNCERILVLE